MITARTAMESKVENVKGRLRELRKEYQSRLDEIKQLWKRRKGDYSRRRSRRDHAPSRRRHTPTMYAEEKDAEEEDNARGSDGSSNSVLYTVTEPETQTEGEMKANREIPEEERRFQVAHKVETEVEVDVSDPSEMKTEKEGDSGDISDLSEMKTKNQSCCRSRNDDDRCVGGGGGSLVEIMSGGGRVMPPSDMGVPKAEAEAESSSGVDELPLSAPPYHSPCLGAVNTVFVKVGLEVLPPPEPPDLDVPKAEVRSSSDVAELPMTAPPLVSPDPCPCLATVKTMAMKGGREVLPLLNLFVLMKMRWGAEGKLGYIFNLMGQAQHDEMKTRILEFVSHPRIGECDSENTWMEFGPNITGTWPVKFGFIAEAIDKHKALGGTKIEVLRAPRPQQLDSQQAVPQQQLQQNQHTLIQQQNPQFQRSPMMLGQNQLSHLNAAGKNSNMPLGNHMLNKPSPLQIQMLQQRQPQMQRKMMGLGTAVGMSNLRNSTVGLGPIGNPTGMGAARGIAGTGISAPMTSMPGMASKGQNPMNLGQASNLDSSNYVYASKPRRSGPFMFFMQYDSSDAKFISILCMLVEGTWSSGLKHFNTSSDSSKAPTIMSLSLERCPKRCSSHGDCNLSFDTSGLTSYSFCFCDQHHGDFDCRIEIATCQGKVWQAILLIVWNAGAILLAYWSLKQKALAEWVKLTFSGTLSYIINNSQGGRVFNEVVAEAKGAGYTEPDTRNDLSGTNVAVESADIVLVQSSLEEVLKWWQNWVPQIELTSQLGSLTSDGRDIPVAGKKQWDPGGPRHTTTVAPQSGFKQWDPGKVCSRSHSLVHLEDKVNFEGEGIDADIRRPKPTLVYERGKWKPTKWLQRCKAPDYS